MFNGRHLRFLGKNAKKLVCSAGILIRSSLMWEQKKWMNFVVTVLTYFWTPFKDVCKEPLSCFDLRQMKKTKMKKVLFSVVERVFESEVDLWSLREGQNLPQNILGKGIFSVQISICLVIFFSIKSPNHIFPRKKLLSPDSFSPGKVLALSSEKPVWKPYIGCTRCASQGFQ